MSAFWFGNKKIYDGFFSEKCSKRMISCKTSELLCDIVRKYIRSALLTSLSLTPPPTMTCSHSTWVPMLCAPLREDVINYNKIYFFMCCVDVWRKWFECSKLRLQPFFSLPSAQNDVRTYPGGNMKGRNEQGEASNDHQMHQIKHYQRLTAIKKIRSSADEQEIFPTPRNKSNQLMLII